VQFAGDCRRSVFDSYGRQEEGFSNGKMKNAYTDQIAGRSNVDQAAHSRQK
jgi:hypothetical protein